MAMKLQISEILSKLSEFTGKGAETKKIEWLRQNDSATLRMMLTHAFDPNIQYDLPEGVPPYKQNESPIGLTENTLFSESRKLSYLWITPSDTAIKTMTNTQSEELQKIAAAQEAKRTELTDAEKKLQKLIDDYRETEELIRVSKIKLANLMNDGRTATTEVNRLKQEIAAIDNAAVNAERRISAANQELENRSVNKELMNKKLNIPKYKREMLFIELLEGLHKDEAKVLLAVKNKTLSKDFPITKDLAKKAFPDLGM